MGELSDVVFQCDHDCVGFAKDNGLRYSKKGDMHTLSDIVAWANNKNREPKGVISMDLTTLLEVELKKVLI